MTAVPRRPPWTLRFSYPFGRGALALLWLGSAGCDLTTLGEQPRPSLATTSAREARSLLPAAPSASATASLGGALPLPRALPPFEHRPCDEAWLAKTSATEAPRPLSLTVIDPRLSPRNLVPGRISAALEAAGANLAATEPRLRGVLYVVDYEPPRLVLMKGETKRKWFDGVVSVRFALVDSRQGLALCGVSFTERTDTSLLSVRLRDEAANKKRLEHQLAAALLTRLRGHLTTLLPGWVLPEAPTPPASAAPTVSAAR